MLLGWSNCVLTETGQIHVVCHLNSFNSTQIQFFKLLISEIYLNAFGKRQCYAKSVCVLLHQSDNLSVMEYQITHKATVHQEHMLLQYLHER